MIKKHAIRQTGKMSRNNKLLKTVSFLALFVVALAFVGCHFFPEGDIRRPPHYIGTKPPTMAKEVGDIVFSDGSAIPYTSNLTLTSEQSNSAIAIIFYKGTGLNSDSNTTSRTLGVGLKHNKSGDIKWCTSSADACNVIITTIQCSVSGSSGALTFTGDKNGSNNLEQIGAFSGVDDTATAANYPAFYFCKNYKNQTGSHVAGTSYESGWYLPSVAELYQIYANGKGTNKVFDIDDASALCYGDTFNTWEYFSSSQWGSVVDEAFTIRFSNGSWNDDSKDGIGFYVCAIREF